MLPQVSTLQKWHLVEVDEGLDGIEESGLHFVNLVEDEQRLRTLTHVAPNPVLKLQLKKNIDALNHTFSIRILPSFKCDVSGKRNYYHMYCMIPWAIITA